MEMQMRRGGDGTGDELGAGASPSRLASDVPVPAASF